MTTTNLKNITESDKRLIAIYHCEHMKFMAMCDEKDCKKMDYYNKTLSRKQISECIEFYNLEKFGVTHKDCKAGKCLACKDYKKCSEVQNA